MALPLPFLPFLLTTSRCGAANRRILDLCDSVKTHTYDITLRFALSIDHISLQGYEAIHVTPKCTRIL